MLDGYVGDPARRFSTAARPGGHRRKGSRCMVLDGSKFNIIPGPVMQWHGDFLFRFSLGGLRVCFGAARRRCYPRLGIMFSPLFPRSVGVFITDGGRVEPYLRRISLDRVVSVFQWIGLDSAGVHCLRSFYKLSSMFSSPRQFASQWPSQGYSQA